MKPKTNLFIYALLGCAVAVTSCDKNSNTEFGNLPEPAKIELRAAEKKMLKSDQAFAFEFFANVFDEEAADKDENFMVSPLSLSMALAMTWNGADGDTKSAIQNTLKMNNYTDDELNGYYKKLKEALLQTDPSTKLSIANSIFTNKFVAIKPDFVRTNQSFYNATVQPVDFELPTTKDVINQWASDNTNGLIKEVIDKTNVYDLMYLLNAIYFKGIWTTKFDAGNTSQKPFTYENGTRKNVDMMQQTAQFNYTADKTVQVVQLPYGNQSFSMLVLLPQEGKKLTDVLAATQQVDYWTNLKSGLRGTEVDLSLPKFKTEYGKKLNDIMEKMGMGIAFSNAADFSRMSDYPAVISFVRQDTYISTDESGTEAAAVTTIGMEFTSAIPTPQKVTFNANRPFIYVIQENSTGAILFMGAVKNFDK